MTSFYTKNRRQTEPLVTSNETGNSQWSSTSINENISSMDGNVKTSLSDDLAPVAPFGHNLKASAYTPTPQIKKHNPRRRTLKDSFQITNTKKAS